MEKLMRGEMPDPRTDRVGPTHMNAQEMDEKMTALVERFEGATVEMRTCPGCSRPRLGFGALWIDGRGWIPMQGCLACRRMFMEVWYDPAGDVSMHEVRGLDDLHDDGQARRAECVRPVLGEGGKEKR